MRENTMSLASSVLECFLETDLNLSDVYEDEDNEDLMYAMADIAAGSTEQDPQALAQQILNDPLIKQFLIGKIVGYIEDSRYYTENGF
jgi:hypothetical protein